MHPYIHQLTVPSILDERRRLAPPRRVRQTGRIARRTGRGLVAVGSALTTTGRRLQEPASGPGAACAAC